jgi:hypothetical protein
MPELSFISLDAEHFFALDLQASQRTQYGVDPLAIDWAEAEAYAAQDNTWAAMREDQVLAVFGVHETFPGAQGAAFALLAKDLGRDHHRLTRFAREEVIAKSPLPRIEAIVRCIDVEPGIKVCPDATPANMLAAALRPRNRTPQVRWALTLGFTPVAVLRKFGAASETHMLLERIR